MNKLIVITGPMFSGKSEELMRLINRAKYANRIILAIKPSEDTRQQSIRVRKINEHGESETVYEYPAYGINDPDAFQALIITKQPNELFIDEAQFFKPWIVAEIKKLLLDRSHPMNIYISGLDQTAWNETFGSMGDLMALANEVKKLTAICFKCNKEANLTFKEFAGSNKVDPGDAEKYKAHCSDCWHPPQEA